MQRMKNGIQMIWNDLQRIIIGVKVFGKIKNFDWKF